MITGTCYLTGYRNTMEEQTADIEVTVKTLDSQSRTYTVGAQVNSSIVIANSGLNSHLTLSDSCFASFFL